MSVSWRTWEDQEMTVTSFSSSASAVGVNNWYWYTGHRSACLEIGREQRRNEVTLSVIQTLCVGKPLKGNSLLLSRTHGSGRSNKPQEAFHSHPFWLSKVTDVNVEDWMRTKSEDSLFINLFHKGPSWEIPRLQWQGEKKRGKKKKKQANNVFQRQVGLQ